MKKFLTTGFVGLLMASGVVAASPAHATTSVALTCSVGNPVTLTPASVTVSSGEQIVFTNNTGANASGNSWGTLIVSPPTTWSNGATVTATATSSGTATFTSTAGCTLGTFTFTVSSSPSPTPSSGSSSGSAPAPYIQQFGLPTSGTCEDAAPDSLNLAGVGSGGWGISWAQWMNDGLGGPVCTRTLAYSTSTQSWVVN